MTVTSVLYVYYYIYYTHAEQGEGVVGGLTQKNIKTFQPPDLPDLIAIEPTTQFARFYVYLYPCSKLRL